MMLRIYGPFPASNIEVAKKVSEATFDYIFDNGNLPKYGKNWYSDPAELGNYILQGF